MRSRRLKILRRFLVYLAVRALLALLHLLPLRAALSLGPGLGRLAARVARRDRRRAEEQLARALALPPPEAARTAEQVFAGLGTVLVELACLGRIRPRLAEYVALPAPSRQVLSAALAEGQGAIFVSAHLGNWELLAQRLALEVPDAVTLARRGANPFLADWLVRARAQGRVETINRGEPRAARRILAALRRGAVIGVLIDQDTRVESVHVPFFGRPASTPTAAAELALYSGAPLLVGFIHRTPAGHEISLERVAALPDPEASRGERVRALTALLTARIEAAVRARPAEWVWFHQRWKRAPLALPPPAADPARRSP